MKKNKLLKILKTTGWKLKSCWKILNPAVERKKIFQILKKSYVKKKILIDWKQIFAEHLKLKAKKFLKNLEPSSILNFFSIEKKLLKKIISNLKPQQHFQKNFFPLIESNNLLNILNPAVKRKSCWKKEKRSWMLTN